MWKASAELEAMGLISSERPRMVAVQTDGCAPIVRAVETGPTETTGWEDPRTRSERAVVFDMGIGAKYEPPRLDSPPVVDPDAVDVERVVVDLGLSPTR